MNTENNNIDTPTSEKNPISVICGKIYDSNKRDDHVTTLQHFEELHCLVEEGLPNNKELRNEILKAWGRAVMAVMSSSGDSEHAAEMVADYEAIADCEFNSYLRALTVEGERPAAVIQAYNHTIGTPDEGAVEGALERYKSASRTDISEVLTVLEVLGIPVTHRISEKLEKFYVLRKDEDPEVLLAELKEDGLTPCSAMLYNRILFKVTLDRKPAMQYYEEMLDYGIKAEAPTLRILMKRDDLSSEDRLTLKRRSKGDGGPSEEFMSKLRSCIDTSNLEEAERLLQQGMLGGLVPDRHVYKLMIDCCGTNTVAAELLYNQMIERGVKPTSSTYQKLISMWKETRQEGIDKWVIEMQKQGMEPDASTTASLLDSYVRNGQRGRAMQLLVSMLTTTGNAHMYNTLMKLGPFDFSIGILGCVLTEGHRITPSAISTLTSMARDSMAKEFIAELTDCNWEPELILLRPFVSNALPNGHPSLIDCMRLMMREIKLDQVTIDRRTKMLLDRCH